MKPIRLELRADQFLEPHPGGEKWERMYAIKHLAEKVHSLVSRETGYDNLVVNNIPIVSLWTTLQNYLAADEGQPLGKITLDVDVITADWDAKLVACGVKGKINEK